ncbi:hypothetical protein [Beijerinckia indica]|uniref:hypothetical protein n=1 Tax=Beijerinckia indica TaxID=533 RepID=UPI0005A18F99|nr:hypothetical protein [Beijerinckia indica]
MMSQVRCHAEIWPETHGRKTSGGSAMFGDFWFDALALNARVKSLTIRWDAAYSAGPAGRTLVSHPIGDDLSRKKTFP